MSKLQWRVKRGSVTLQVGFTVAGMALKLEEEFFEPVRLNNTVLNYTIDREHQLEGEQLANALLGASLYFKSVRVVFSDRSCLSIESGAAHPPDAPLLLRGWSSGGGAAVIHLRDQELRKLRDAVHDFFQLNWATSY
jgi:hypothetical protein